MDRDQGGASANNSSDFVRKLYKMLEDSQYETTVRWGDDGESFVVLEIERFTKDVLPRHFKHSNFASFVRQLNKYDFHKVRQNNEDNGQTVYGQGVWEFTHPEFKKNGKDALDNIKRKAPAPRKTTQIIDDQPAQQIDLLNTQLSATQHQFQILQEKYSDLAQGHIVLHQNTVQLQKIVKNHSFAMQKIVNYVHILASQNRRLSRSGPFRTNGTANGIEEMVAQENGTDDNIDTPLRQAADLLGEYSVDNLVNTDLDAITHDFTMYRGMDYSTPPNDANNPMAMPIQGVGEHGVTMDFGDMNDLDMVYPIGQTRGIDPINKDHINNIPYSLPTTTTEQNVNGTADMTDAIDGKDATLQQKAGKAGQIWGFRRPRVMLVEDDKTCSRIGCRFLQNFDCHPVLAKDGLEAVGKMNNQAPNEKIDLVLMDIIMPKLDGVSATSVIREFDRSTPIIAMTSNIRTDDIEVYFRYGMNDVLPKPFTKEGMLRCLEKHLACLKAPGMRSYNLPIENVDPHPGYVTTGATSQAMNMNNISHITAPQSIKDDSPAARSPATSWHSPNSNSITCPSPTSAGPPDAYNMHPLRQGASNNYAMGGTNHGLRNMESPPIQSMAAPRQGINHRRVMSDMTNGPDEHPDTKRQRMYPPQQMPNTSNNFT